MSYNIAGMTMLQVVCSVVLNGLPGILILILV